MQLSLKGLFIEPALYWISTNQRAEHAFEIIKETNWTFCKLLFHLMRMQNKIMHVDDRDDNMLTDIGRSTNVIEV